MIEFVVAVHVRSTSEPRRRRRQLDRRAGGADDFAQRRWPHERAVANDRDECEIGDPQGKIGLGALLQIGGGVFILGDLGARNIALPGAVAGAIEAAP
jgi:hypothetical protein